ncbi:MAG: hypothetical protein GX239_09465 [Clostridiaceae bacterium]|nr:hypothetical protein [Clostridiaceae bacterium]
MFLPVMKTVISSQSAVTVSKTADKTELILGETINYTVVVINTRNVTIDSVRYQTVLWISSQ